MTGNTPHDHNTAPPLTDVLARVLGPPGPEVTCEQCFDLLDVYVESRLAGDHDVMPPMRAHLDGCPACREDFESLRELVSETRRSQDA